MPLTGLLIIPFVVSLSFSAMAGGRQPFPSQATIRDTITRGGYTLLIVNNEPDFNPQTLQKLIDAFFTVYPEEADRFNKNTLKQVTFFIDPTYKGVAETGNGVARYSPAWLKEHPEDIDVVTHEVMQKIIVQGITVMTGPGWLSRRNCRDYVRYAYMASIIWKS